MIYFKALLKYKNLFNRVNALSDQVKVCTNPIIKKIFILKIEKMLSKICLRFIKV